MMVTGVSTKYINEYGFRYKNRKDAKSMFETISEIPPIQA